MDVLGLVPTIAIAAERETPSRSRLRTAERRMSCSNRPGAEHDRLKKAGRIVALVFHRNGKRIRNVRGAWKSACEAPADLRLSDCLAAGLGSVTARVAERGPARPAWFAWTLAQQRTGNFSYPSHS